MVLPFGLGCAISYGLYNEFRNDPGTVPVDFGTYLLFVGIAMAITVRLRDTLYHARIEENLTKGKTLGFPRSVPDFDRIETAQHQYRCYCSVGGSRQ